MTQPLGDAPGVAARWLQATGDRWRHVQAVGQRAEALARDTCVVPATVTRAAWLHDIGYAPVLAETGFHPLDGARYLAGQGESDAVVALVAHHSGARYEADERGLAHELAALPDPNLDDLDMLTFLDLTTSPQGQVVTVEERLSEILSRYGEDDPVHRAVTRSRDELVASVERAKAALRSADVGTRLYL
ncbi:HD domain-containing protein [Aquipuribacter nitratireducens]|uniref:HD domain-containing protein n=1 Tax=Aquipuribacter nitratireducens TaxID=650104 RepID=A0ABW0GQB0_9MICO